MTEPILSRFDVLCVVKDNADPVLDEMLAKFVVGSHLRSHPDFVAERDEIKVATTVDADIIPAEMLKKYIQYARDRVRPKLAQLDVDKLSRLYADLRRESLSTGALPVSVRHLEAMIRMAEASAKMHLREFVQSNDIDLAIQVTVNSFVSAQKISIKKQLERGFRKYIHKAQDQEELLSFLLGQLIKDRYRHDTIRLGRAPARVDIKVADLEERARELSVHDVQPFLGSALFRANGYSHRQELISKLFDDGGAL